jgi:hypothetical protein
MGRNSFDCLQKGKSVLEKGLLGKVPIGELLEELGTSGTNHVIVKEPYREQTF